MSEDIPEYSSARGNRERVTVEIPSDRHHEFFKLVHAFLGAKGDHDAQVRQRSLDRHQGVASLRALVQVAQGKSGQCRHLASFVAGLYNGPRFPFDLTDLRTLDDELFEHCMAVLRLDGRHCEKEVHEYFVDGGKLWEENIIDAWALDRVVALDSARRLTNYLEREDSPSTRELIDALQKWREREQDKGSE